MIKIMKIKVILIIIHNKNSPGMYIQHGMIAKAQIWFKSARHVSCLLMFSYYFHQIINILYATLLHMHTEESDRRKVPIIPLLVYQESRFTGQVYTSVCFSAVFYSPNSIDIQYALCLTI